MSNETNKTMLQAFEWYLEPDFNHWNHLKELAGELKASGIDMVWLPPAYKEFRTLVYRNPETQQLEVTGDAVHATGYGVYDKYDLGEFQQVGETSKTKYGSKDEYLECIAAFHKKKIAVILDIVMNHMLGAEGTETVSAYKYKKHGDRSAPIEGPFNIEAPTVFNFPKRNGAYNTDCWNHNDFNAVSFGNEDSIFLFEGKAFNPAVDEGRDIDNGQTPYRNFDYLMGSNIDFTNPNTQRKLLDWLRWYIELTGAEGIRLDAVKHIDYRFIPKMMEEIRSYKSEDFFAVGEYWSSTEYYGELLLKYLDKIDNSITLFDVPLHSALQAAFSENANFDLRTVFYESILKTRPELAVTFVDNHDTQPGQMLGPCVSQHFKQHAYAMILFQKGGIPCVFYGDLYGIPHDNLPAVSLLDKMCRVRKSCAHGAQKDYVMKNLDIVPLDLTNCDEYEKNRRTTEFNQAVEENNRRKNYYGYTRAGVKKYPYSGMAVMVSNGCGGTLRMHVNARYAGEKFVNLLDPSYDPVFLNEDGDGQFFVRDYGVAVWIREKAYTFIMKIGKED